MGSQTLFSDILWSVKARHGFPGLVWPTQSHFKAVLISLISRLPTLPFSSSMNRLPGIDIQVWFPDFVFRSSVRNSCRPDMDFPLSLICWLPTLPFSYELACLNFSSSLNRLPRMKSQVWFSTLLCIRVEKDSQSWNSSFVYGLPDLFCSSSIQTWIPRFCLATQSHFQAGKSYRLFIDSQPCHSAMDSHAWNSSRLRLDYQEWFSALLCISSSM